MFNSDSSHSGDHGKQSVLGRFSSFERGGFDGRQRKLVGQLLLDGRTLEEPGHQPVVLNVPQTSRRRLKK